MPEKKSNEPKRNYITRIIFEYRDGDRLVSERNKNQYNGLFEDCHDSYWLEKLSGMQEDIEIEKQRVLEDKEKRDNEVA